MDEIGSPQRVVLVTGASRGIGAAAAVQVGQEGWGRGRPQSPDPQRVSEADKVAKAVKDHGGLATVFIVDVSDGDSVVGMFDAIEEQFGAVNSVVLNASAALRHGWADASQSDWDRVLAVNLRGAAASLVRRGTVLAALGRGGIGGDWRDPHWVRAEPAGGSYMSAAGAGVESMRIGIVTEAAESTACSATTVNAFQGAGVLEGIGARVRRVSVPLWSGACVIWLATITFALTVMADSYGRGRGRLGCVEVGRVTVVADQFRRGVRGMLQLSPTLPLTFAHLPAEAPGVYAALAQNLRLELRRQVDELLRDLDLLTMPTGPTRLRLDHRSEPVEPVSYTALLEVLTNTVADLTGHPALTVPSGPGDNELPTGLQIIGRRSTSTPSTVPALRTSPQAHDDKERKWISQASQ